MLCCLSAGVQIAYLALYYIAVSRITNWPAGDDRNEQGVSIIICAHNEHNNLRRLLPRVLSQVYPSFEVIVVDDRSTDDTLIYLNELAQNHSNLKVISVQSLPQDHNGKKHGLNLAIQAADHEILLLTDADCIPASNLWCDKMVSSFDENTAIVLGYSPYFYRDGWLNRFIRYETRLTALQYIGFAYLGMPYMGVGRNLAYRKSFFLQVGGFKGIMHMVGGDDDLLINQWAKAANTKVCLEKEAVVYSQPELNLTAFFKQKIRHLSVGKRYRIKHVVVLAVFYISYMILFLSIPWVSWEPTAMIFIGMLWITRFGLLALGINQIGRFSGDRIRPYWVFFLDIIYVFYYISTGLKALLTKKVKWTS